MSLNYFTCLTLILLTWLTPLNATEHLTWSLTPGAYLFDYTETLSPPQKSHEHGQVPYLALTAKLDHPAILNGTGFLLANLQVGETTLAYSGTLRNTDTLVTGVSDLLMVNLSGEIHQPGWFAGVSGSFWKRYVAQEFYENYGWVSLYAGPEWIWRPTPKWELSLNAGLEFTPFALMNYPNGDNQNFSISGTVGYQMACSARYHFTPDLTVTLTPWLHFYNFSQSESETPGGISSFEPASSTLLYGVSAGVGW